MICTLKHNEQVILVFHEQPTVDSIKFMDINFRGLGSHFILICKFVDLLLSPGLGLLCSTPLSTIFQLYRGGELYLRRKPEKITDLVLITDKFH